MKDNKPCELCGELNNNRLINTNPDFPGQDPMVVCLECRTEMRKEVCNMNYVLPYTFVEQVTLTWCKNCCSDVLRAFLSDSKVLRHTLTPLTNNLTLGSCNGRCKSIGCCAR